jgi:hypothetical protein
MIILPGFTNDSTLMVTSLNSFLKKAYLIGVLSIDLFKISAPVSLSFAPNPSIYINPRYPHAHTVCFVQEKTW